MPLFKVSTRKAANSTPNGPYKWSNTYYVMTDTVNDALTVAGAYWEFGERLFHSQDAFCYEVYANAVGDAPQTPGEVLAVSIGVQRGALARALQPLPPFNVVRVDLPMVGSRPSRKFYRPVLDESMLLSGSLTDAFVLALSNGMAYITSNAYLRDESGNLPRGAGINRGLTSRRLGRDADRAVPEGPSFG